MPLWVDIYACAIVVGMAIYGEIYGRVKDDTVCEQKPKHRDAFSTPAFSINVTISNVFTRFKLK